MGNYKSIEEYRRKKKIAGFLKKLLLLLVIIGILVVLINVLELFKDTKIQEFVAIKTEEAKTPEFPVMIKNEQMVDFVTFSNSFGVLSKSSVFIYNSNGKKTNSFLHGYTNPVTKTGGKRIMTYDRGGTKLRIDTATDTVGEIKTKFPIITATVSSSGTVAIISAHDRYPCEVTVYDANLKNMIYRYYATEEFSSVAFSNNGQKLYTASIVAVGGILSCNFYDLSITDETPAKITLIKDILPLCVLAMNEDTINIVGKDCIVSLDSKTLVQTRYTFKGELRHYADSSQNETVVVNRNILSGYSTLTVVSSNGTAVASVNIDDDVLDVYSDGSRVVVLCKGTVYNYDMALMKLDEIKLKKTMNKLVYIGTNLFVLGSDSVEKYNIS